MKKYIFLIIGILMISSLANAQTPGGLNVKQGGTGFTSVSPGSLIVGGTSLRLSATTSPTIGYFTATSTTATSTMAGNLNVIGNIQASRIIAPVVTSLTGDIAINGTLTVTSLTANRIPYTSTNGLLVTGDNLSFNGTNAGIGTSTPFARLAVTGSGIATGNLFQLADNTNAPKVTVLDNGNVGIGTTAPGYALDVVGTAKADAFRLGTVGANSPYIWPYSGSAYGTPVTTGRSMAFYSYSLNAGDIGFSFIGEPLSITTGNYTNAQFLRLFVPTSGTGTFVGLSVNPTINQTGGANGISRGLYINPTITAAADWRAIETTVGNVIFGSTSGNVGIGTTGPTQKLDVAGFINTDQYSGYKQAGNTILYASSTSYSTMVGQGAGAALLSDGSYNTALGYLALNTATSTDYNTAVGYYALKSNIDGGEFNTAYGAGSLLSNTTGFRNTASGYSSLQSNTSGVGNNAYGYLSLASNTTGTYNVASGYNSLFSNTTGHQNSAIGLNALYPNTTGYYNIALGANAGRYITDGATDNQTSNTSVYLGGATKALADGDTNEIVIGYNATGVGSNSAVLGNDSITKTILKGNVGIGTTTPNTKLNIYGGGVGINPGATAQPTCTNATRGLHWMVFGGAGVADLYQVCMKDAADNYAWVTK